MEMANRPLILVVDDTPKNLTLVAQILVDHGYEPALAEGGPQALAFAAQRKPDLILLDVLMPDMDGIEVCRKFKADPATQGIPIIFLSAMATTDDTLSGFEAGAVDYVTKPFRIPELLARVRVHVDLYRAKQEIRTLRGILPTCAHCKSIRDDQGHWVPMESFITSRSEVEISHGLCPDCLPIYVSDPNPKNWNNTDVN